MNEKRREYKDLGFTDDFMFCHVLENNPELCKEIAETILDVKIKDIVKLDKQHIIKPTRDGKGVRFDVYFEDDEDTVYDIEMQNANADSLRKRSRYYQSMIDRKTLGKNKKYDKLRKTYIIFVCKFDLFGAGLPKYTFENVCLEDKSILLGDESTKVFVNSEGDLKGASEELRDFLSYVSSGAASGDLSKKIAAEVELARMDPEMEEAYMTFEEYLDERYELGRATGLAEGHAYGLAEASERAAKVLSEKLNVSIDEALSMISEEK